MTNIEKIKLERRKSELAMFKTLFDVDFEGKIDPEIKDIYEKCLNLELSIEEFCDKLCNIVKKRYEENQSIGVSTQKDEKELNLSIEQATELFGFIKK